MNEVSSIPSGSSGAAIWHPEMARADLCRFLAACYYQPEAAFEEDRMFDAMAACARALDPEMTVEVDGLGAAFRAEALQTLLQDYTRIFLGPVSALASPYGSVWLDDDGHLMDESTSRVIELYDSAGFGVAEDFTAPPDHIAVELEFLYLLLFRETEAVRNADDEALSTNRDTMQALFDDHLGQWFGRFTAAVEKGAQTGFYRELAGISRAFLEGEARRLATA